jgi:hypothetical protein
MNEENQYFKSFTDNPKGILKHPLVKVAIGIGGTLILILVVGEVMKIMAGTISSFKDLKNAINS